MYDLAISEFRYTTCMGTVNDDFMFFVFDSFFFWYKISNFANLPQGFKRKPYFVLAVGCLLTKWIKLVD
jgi:hypothetical protein